MRGGPVTDHHATVDGLKHRYCGPQPDGSPRLVMCRIVRYRVIGPHSVDSPPWRLWFFMYGGRRKVREEALNCLPGLIARVNKRRSVNTLKVEVEIDGEPGRVTATERQKLAAEHEGKRETRGVGRGSGEVAS